MSNSPLVVTSAHRRHRTLAERALADLQEAILSGELAPGTPLRLEALARSLDMSPMPIREAVRELERLGLAEHVPHRGARVSRVSVEDLRDTYAARLLLESAAIRLAAGRFADEHAQAARASLDEHVAAFRAGDEVRSRAAHADFHFGLYAASGSSWLPRLIRPLWESSERYRIASLYDRGSLERRRAEHEQILDACVAQDADAAEDALRAHLVTTEELVARHMGSGV